jgi:ABC-type branched-subunit amino acid transport system substrate-binding protein
MMSSNRVAMALCALVPLWANAENANGVTEKEIVIGSAASYHGVSAGLGTEQLTGSLVYFNSINDAGGINGRKIRVIAYDDDYNPKPCVTATLKLLKEDKVFALFDSVGTPTAVEQLPVIKQFENDAVFQFGMFTGAQPQREPPYDKIAYNVRASYRQETGAAVDFFVDKLGCKKVCGFWQQDAYGWSGRDGTKRRLKARNMSLVKDVTYERGQKFEDDYSAQVDALKKAGCECLVMVGAYQGCGGMIRAVRESGWDLPMDNVSFVGASQMLKVLREHEKKTGKDITYNLLNTQVVPNPIDKDVPLVKEYQELRAKYRTVPVPDTAKTCCGTQTQGWVADEHSFGQLEGYINAKLFVEILKKAGPKLTRESFRAAADGFDADLGGLKGKFGKDDGSPEKPANQFSSTVYVTYLQPGADWQSVTDWSKVLKQKK